MSQYRASHNGARITARKARLAADLVRGLPVNHALSTLQFSVQRSCRLAKADHCVVTAGPTERHFIVKEPHPTTSPCHREAFARPATNCHFASMLLIRANDPSPNKSLV